METGVCSEANLCFVLATGAGVDGVEEIKRHPFFVTIDWNVSHASPCPAHTGDEVRCGVHQLGADQRGLWPCPPAGLPSQRPSEQPGMLQAQTRAHPYCSTGPESPSTLQRQLR